MPINETPQSNKQHAVPQNIMDVEFKLIGDLTMRQFFYLLVFVGGAYVLYSIPGLPNIVKIPAILFSILAGVGFAFMPVEDRGLDEWIVYFLKAVFTENQRVWRKEATPLTAFMYDNISMVKQELITLAPTASRRKLERYLEGQHLQVSTDAYDQREQEYIQKTQVAFADMMQQQVVTTTVLEEPKFEFEEGEEEIEKTVTSVDIAPEKEAIAETTLQKEIIGQPKQQVAPSEVTTPITTETKVTAKTPKKEIAIKSSAKKIEKKARVKQEIIIPTRPITPLTPITPNRHTGRMFTSMLPNEGTIVLPIRGERIIKPQAEQELDAKAAEKAQQLKDYIEQVKTTKGIKTQPKQDTTPKEETKEEEVVVIKEENDTNIDEEAKGLIKKLKKDNERLQGQINKLQKDVTKAEPSDKKEKEEALKKLQKESGKTTKTIAKLIDQVSSLTGSSPEELAEEETEAAIAPVASKESHLKQTQPNIVAGIVKNSTGNAIPHILLIIKNAKNDPVRAIKTNNLGEFIITNPLPNGSYKIEVDINNATGKTFDIIEFEARGEIIQPMEFVGK